MRERTTKERRKRRKEGFRDILCKS